MPDCPQADQHTPAPDGYIAWHDWAQRMSRTHRQRRCGGCGLFKVWEPKRSSTVPRPAVGAGPTKETR